MSSSSSQANHNFMYKWIALISLVLQNSGLAIMMRYSFLYAKQTNSPLYIASTAIVVTEIVKLFISSLCAFEFDANRSWMKYFNILYTEFIIHRVDFIKLMIPSLLYTIQNTLQYYAISTLSAPLFQVFAQMKIITTAIFAVLILKKSLSTLQWAAIVALAGGVATVQLSQMKESSSGSTEQSNVSGIIAIVVACVLSGFAGIYFEMMLKSSNTSIWLRNIQLSVIGIVLAMVSKPSSAAHCNFISPTTRPFVSSYFSFPAV
jgi:UDP-sugar transporter A1/2/3